MNETTRHSTTMTGLKALWEIYLIGIGASLAIALLIYTLQAAPPHVQAWYTAWKVQQVHAACARHNGIDLSPYHLRSSREEEIMAQCLQVHLPR